MNVHLGPSFSGHIAFVRDRVVYMRRRLVTGACPHGRISHTVCVRVSGVEDGDPSQGCPRRSRLQECAACVFKHPGVAFSRRAHLRMNFLREVGSAVFASLDGRGALQTAVGHLSPSMSPLHYPLRQSAPLQNEVRRRRFAP